MSKKIIAVCLTDTHLKEENIEINKSVYRQTIQFCKDNHISSIEHLGDVFNSRKAQTQEVLVAFSDILSYFKEANIDFHSLKGNHDCTFYGGSESFLQPFGTHPNFLLYSSKSKRQITPSLHFNYLSYFSEEKYIEELQLLNSTLDKKVKNILFTHIDIDGGVMNNGVVMSNRITRDLFSDYDAVYIGHWHDKQFIEPNIHFIGSSIQHNYGESPNKGLTVIYDDLSWETVELEFPRYIKLEVDIDKLTPSDIEQIRKESETSTDNLRVVLVGSEEKIKSFNKNLLLTAGISVEQKIDKINKTEVDSRVEAYTSKTLFDEFTNFCNKNQLNREEGLKYLEGVL